MTEIAQPLDREHRNRREIVTPEGVPLRVELGDYGERVTAFCLDQFICDGAAVLLTLAIILLTPARVGSVVGTAMALFFAFILRTFYYIHFELLWQGATPGKRIVGLRVIDRLGGPLKASAVVARNLTREVEIFLPLGLLLGGGGQETALSRLALAAWLLLLTALPFFNRDRLRAGDLIAGTMVVAMPRRVLAVDLVERAIEHRFTQIQLGSYGAFELQILEQLLRRPDGPETRLVHREVCDKICRKIGWEQPVLDADVGRFLRDFYTAERAFLEKEQLFGKPRADKHYQDRAKQ